MQIDLFGDYVLSDRSVQWCFCFFLVTVQIHQLKFKEFHIDWYEINDVYFYSEAASSRFYRRMGNAVGMQKSSG